MSYGWWAGWFLGRSFLLRCWALLCTPKRLGDGERAGLVDADQEPRDLESRTRIIERTTSQQRGGGFRELRQERARPGSQERNGQTQRKSQRGDTDRYRERAIANIGDCSRTRIQVEHFFFVSRPSFPNLETHT